jgi:hypothetical protein
LAQHEYDVWYFSQKGRGLDFRTTPPVMITGTPAHSAEGLANYCDPKTGEPLFGCDGAGIMYDKNGNPMPNGVGIESGQGTSSQGAAIIPLPCSKTKFIVVTTDLYGYSRDSRGSHYSIVDMSLNGGLGDVTEKNVLLNPNTDEHMTIVWYGIGTDGWAILHSQGGNTFFAYRISSKGIDATPVVSHCGKSHSSWLPVGCLKASPNGRKLAIANSGAPLVELFDFDPFTGKVFNPITVEDTTLLNSNGVSVDPYGVCFSPDNSKLYYGIWYHVKQCDLTDPSPNSILNSRQIVSNRPNQNLDYSWYHTALEIGPDKKIYIATPAKWVSVIDNPNELGRLCNFKDKAYESKDFLGIMGLPNNIEGRPKPLPDTLFTIKALQDTITKEGIFVPILLSLREQYTDLTIYGHYDVSSVELRSVSSGGQPVSANISKANGTFTIELPAGMNLQGVQLDWYFDPKRNTSSSTVIIDSVEFAGSTISCQPFTQVITVQPQCGDIILQHFLSTGGLPQFTLTPNPAENVVTIKSSKDVLVGSFVLYDQLGKKVLDESHRVSTTVPISLDVSTLPTGIYYLRITSNQFSTTKSVIIDH